MQKVNNKALLMILDGWGQGDGSRSDIISSTPTPNMDALKQHYPHSILLTSGENVGLPEGQMGNSEVGHLNIGAGRVVYQDLVKINRACADNSIADNPVLQEAFEYAATHKKAVHFLGLVSDGGVHSMDTHLYKLCDLTREYSLKKVYIHALTDGRDTDPQSGLGFIQKLESHLAQSNGTIATLTGRYYTMDRDKRWERIRMGYDALVHGKGTKVHSVTEAMRASYAQGVTDEFIKPLVVVDDNDEPIGKIFAGDVVICFNFRTDRLRQITHVLTQQDMPEQGMNTLPLKYYTLTRYDDRFKAVKVIYDKENVRMTMGEVVAAAGRRQLRIAETEKYAHVTFFFSGGREEVFEGEKRIMIPSPKVATYDLQPEMSAFLVKDAIIKELNEKTVDFAVLNFANGDMVGHTGVYDAIVKAVQTVDQCVGEVVTAARNHGYDVLIIADHGNADYAVNPDGSPNTAHSTNPVPAVLVSDYYTAINPGILADVAPTLLKILDIPQPEEMTGKALI
ncbi:MAG: 2,3-bisphosphoglycerate-independent phosphoglycerate mutase [Bacteroidales bacterium]|nr:2,3-bisphosphoglycerate-independent phosphoglycerate mutase [Bacteroidales bacterium]MDD3961988.1 2,3-bisphosphoglycerate-independent phosphoglycerate mutase [Bacteroidales bacterium]MDY0284909.1 2,3-bisphosphoglycerate-independent phosphoglycerate mutase [Bacteroidales bacterium]